MCYWKYFIYSGIENFDDSNYNFCDNRIQANSNSTIALFNYMYTQLRDGESQNEIY